MARADSSIPPPSDTTTSRLVSPPRCIARCLPALISQWRWRKWVTAKPSRRRASRERDRFEVEGASVEALAKRHNVASSTTVRRRARAEGWQKGVNTPTSLSSPPLPPLNHVCDADLTPMAGLVSKRALHKTAAQVQAGSRMLRCWGRNTWRRCTRSAFWPRSTSPSGSPALDCVSSSVTAVNNRRFVDAVLYRYRTGIPWRDLPETLGDWNNSIGAPAPGLLVVSGNSSSPCWRLTRTINTP